MLRASFQHAVVIHINNVSLKDFEVCDNLKDLFILGKVSDGDQCVSTSPYPKLSSLRIRIARYSARVDSWLRSNTLHTLSLRFDGLTTLLSVRKLIETCSTTLVNLTLRGTGYDSRYHQSHNPDQLYQHPIQFRNLNQLNLRIPVCVVRDVCLSSHTFRLCTHLISCALHSTLYRLANIG